MLFIQKDFFPHYGVLCLASAVRKAGHTCDLTITDIDDFSETLVEFRPDVIALTFTSGQLPWAKETARLTRDLLGKEIPILVGGFHPTFFPEVVLEGWCDIAARGEADLSFPLLLKAIKGGTPLEEVPNLAFPKGGSLHLTPVELPSCLDALPFPAYDLLKKYGAPERLGYINLRASRGCTYDCRFCYSHALRTLLGLQGAEFFRRKAPRSVIAEIQYGRTFFPGLRFIKFDDDTFNTPPDSWLAEFVPLYKKDVGLPFSCLGRIDLVNESNANLLRDAGCTVMRYGVEHADESFRNGIYGKRLSTDALRSGVRILRKHGVVGLASNMVWAQRESIKDSLGTYAFNLSLGVDVADCLNMHIYRGSPFTKEGEPLQYHGNYFYFFPQGRASREYENLVCLFPCAIALRMPPRVLSLLIRAPRNPLYRVLLWIGQIYIKLRMKEYGVQQFVRLRVFAREFFGFPSFRLLVRRKRSAAIHPAPRAAASKNVTNAILTELDT